MTILNQRSFLGRFKHIDMVGWLTYTVWWLGKQCVAVNINSSLAYFQPGHTNNNLDSKDIDSAGLQQKLPVDLCSCGMTEGFIFHFMQIKKT